MRRERRYHAANMQSSAAVIIFTLAYILYRLGRGLLPSYVYRILSASTALPHSPSSCILITHEQSLYHVHHVVSVCYLGWYLHQA